MRGRQQGAGWAGVQGKITFNEWAWGRTPSEIPRCHGGATHGLQHQMRKLGHCSARPPGAAPP
jgi:hypothetical protein